MPDQPRLWIQPYYPAFNGLRGIAILSVFLHHYGDFLAPRSSLLSAMWSGVDLFFVLSGFLITGILYDSVHEPNFFRNFYIRRALRIFPIFYGLFALLFVLTPMLHLHWSRLVLTYCAYVGNLVTPFLDLSRHDNYTITLIRSGRPIQIGNLIALWSLCVEEQFYLVWPAIVWLVRDRRKLMWICGAVCIFTLGLRLLLLRLHAPGINQELLHLSTFARWDTLLLGGWLALWLRGTPLSRRQLHRYGIAAIVTGVITLFALVHFHLAKIRFDNPRVETFGFSCIALAAAGVLLLSCNGDSKLGRALQWRPLAWLGTISYGFYILHDLPRYALHAFVSHHPSFGGLIFAGLFAAVALAAALSFRFFESPFLRLKNRLAPQQPRAHPHLPEPRPVMMQYEERNAA